ncbi:MAG: dihydroorotate dehydrogenase [Patescibacteria group bacterium]
MPLQTKFLNLTLKNPITTGAGTFGYGEEISEFIDVSKLGAIVVKGTSLEPWPGNPSHRICETPSGMLNAIGLQNPGLESFIQNKLPKLRKLGTKVIVSIFDKTAENFVKVAERLDQEVKNNSGKNKIDGLEVNLSCPNVKAGGATFCAKPDLMGQVISQIKKVTSLPIIAKLSPNVTDIVEVAKAAVDSGADALTLINTLVGMSIDIKTRRPRLRNNIGGLSGPAIHPVAVACVWKVHRALPSVPIIGIGGVYDVNSALEMILAGANLVGIGTANFYNPRICLEIIEGMKRYCEDNGVENICELRGGVRDY